MMQRNPYLKDKNGKQDARVNLPARLKLLLAITLTLMIALILQLAFLTIKQGADFQAEVNRSDETVEKGNQPRGLIYDAKGQIITGNKAQTAITFTRGTNMNSVSMRKTAVGLGKYLTVDTQRLTDRARIDFYLANTENAEKIQKIVTKDHKKGETLTTSDILNKEVAYLKANKSLLNDQDDNEAMIFQRMSGAYQLSTTFIKESDLTSVELAKIGERLSQFPGIKIGISWTRQYPQGEEFKSLIGNVTNEATGLPENRVNTLLAQGYSQNEPVGNSSLEQAYEATLKGSASQTVVKSSTDGSSVVSNIKYKGQAGDNLKLTIDAKFQKSVQEILEKNMPDGDTEGAYATVINPYTGGIYAMAGVDRDHTTNKQTTNPLGNINHPIVMGSAVKPAMLATGLQHGVITPENNTLTDQAIKLAGTPSITSYWNKAGTPKSISAQTALEVSSNTYMVQLAMMIGGQKYVSGAALGLKSGTFQVIRNGFGQFGLGSKTGIDIVGETAGYKGPTDGNSDGKLLYESFGNFDSYTVLQMARYVSAIANGGYLVQPHLVGSITESTANNDQQKTVWSSSPTLQGQVKLTSEQWRVIKEGMHLVANGSSPWNTGGTDLHKLSPKVNAKTGTAETTTNGNSTVTESVILYVPGQPMALALAIPGMNNYLDGTDTKIAAEIVNAFWKNVMSKPK